MHSTREIMADHSLATISLSLIFINFNLKITACHLKSLRKLRENHQGTENTTKKRVQADLRTLVELYTSTTQPLRITFLAPVWAKGLGHKPALGI